MKLGTPFGRALRKMRIDRGETLADLAKVLDVSPAFLSAIEIGKKHVPETMFDKLRTHYKLDKQRWNDLRDAEKSSRSKVAINTSSLDGSTREFVAVFARRFQSLSAADRAVIEKVLKRRE